jgi:hypothetical protein
VAGLWDAPSESLGKQIDCVKKLQEIFDGQDDYKLIIRVHPNLKNKSKSQIKAWNELENTKNSIVLDHTYADSSYTILDNSIGVITFGSTVGLEAAYLKIPSLVLTDCGYDLLGVVDKAKNWDEVTEWISQINDFDNGTLETRKINSCIRGYFLETAGRKFQFSNLIENGWGKWEVISMCGFKISDVSFLRFNRMLLGKIKMLFSTITVWN